MRFYPLFFTSKYNLVPVLSVIWKNFSWKNLSWNKVSWIFILGGFSLFVPSFATETSIYTNKPIPFRFTNLTLSKLKALPKWDQIDFCKHNIFYISIENSSLLTSKLCKNILTKLEKESKNKEQNNWKLLSPTNFTSHEEDSSKETSSKETSSKKDSSKKDSSKKVVHYKKSSSQGASKGTSRRTSPKTTSTSKKNGKKG